MTMPPRPAKPTLSSITRASDGGMCMSPEDTARLATYVLQLESGYK
jgi:hypothetical protein